MQPLPQGERKLRRQESASSALGGGTGGSIMSNGSILHRHPNPSSSTTLPPRGLPVAPSNNNSSSNSGALDGESARQWEEYYQALEADHAELRQLYDRQRSELTALAAVLAEQKLKSSELQSLESKLGVHEGFLREVMDLLTTDGADTGSRPRLKPRADINADERLKRSPTIDLVRDAIQKQQRRLQALRHSEESNQAALRTMQRESADASAASPRSTAAAAEKNAAGKYGNAGGRIGDDCLVPASAKELEEARRQLHSLERRLQSSEKDARGLTAELKKTELELSARTRSVDGAQSTLAETQKVLEAKEQLLSDTERRCKAAEKELRAMRKQQQQQEQQSTTPAGGVSPVNASMASLTSSTAGKDSELDTTSNSVTASGSQEKLVATQHFCLLKGDSFAALLSNDRTAAELREAVRQDLSAAVHVPTAFLEPMELRAVGGSDGRAAEDGEADSSSGVGIDVRVKHCSRLHTRDVDVLLLECAFPRAGAVRSAGMDRLLLQKQREVAQVRAESAAAKTAAQSLAKRVQSLETAMQARDADREATDADVGRALEEAEATVKELYGALDAERKRSDSIQRELSTLRETAQRTSSGSQSQLAAAEAATRDLQRRYDSVVKDMEKTSATNMAEIAELRENLQAATVEVGIAVFELPPAVGQTLIGEDLGETLVQLTADGASRSVRKALHGVLLCEAAVATGTVPVQVTRCAYTRPPASRGGLQLAVELAFYANPENTEHVRADITDKLARCGFPLAVAFLQSQRDQSAALRDSSDAALAVQSVVEKRLDAAMSSSDRRAAPSAPEKVDLLVCRLRDCEAALRKSKDALAEADRRSSAAAKDSVAAAESATLLAERVKRLEAALKEKTAALAAVTDAAKADVSALKAASEAESEQRRSSQEELVRYTADFKCRERELSNTVQAQGLELKQLTRERDGLKREAARNAATQASQTTAMEQLKQRLAALEAKASGAAANKPAGAAEAAQVRALEDALRKADSEREQLRRQVGEMETDMNDFANIQASLQSSLETAQAELRAKKQDFDLLTRQVARLEEKSSQQKDELKRLRERPAAALSSPASPGEDIPVDVDRSADGAAAVERRSANSSVTSRGTGTRRRVSAAAADAAVSLSSSSANAAAAVERSRGGATSAPQLVRGARGFSRTASATIISSSTAASSPTTSATTAAATPTAAAAAAPAAFARSATATVTLTRGTSKKAIDTPPRLAGNNGLAAPAHVIALQRQDSRKALTATTPAVRAAPKAAAADASQKDSDGVGSLTRERRHLSPVAGSSKGVGLRRPPSPTVNAHGSHATTASGVTGSSSSGGGSGVNAFHRSNTATVGTMGSVGVHSGSSSSATAAPTTAFSRTASGYRRGALR